MKKRHKIYLRLNLISLAFVVVSFISVTLAWFAYSGLVNTEMEIGVKAWYIELEKDGQAVSNDIVIALSEIQPGMDITNEVVKIKNLGDSDALVKYEIVSARILDDPDDNYVVDGNLVKSPYVEDKLSHDYPFHININLDKGYVLSKGTESIFEVSVSWPLDSDNNNLDSFWGSESYKFGKSEQEKFALDSNYQIRPSIQVVISVTAEQYVDGDDVSDVEYNLGDTLLYDVVNKSVCTEISGTCLNTHIIDVNNKLSDTTVTLLPDLSNNYLSSTYTDYNTTMATIINGWTVDTRGLVVEDLLKVISNDITNSFLIRNGMSNSIIGYLNYENRMSTEINKAISYNGYYSFVNTKYSYLNTDNCFWTNSVYNTDNTFAFKKIDETNSKVYAEAKTTSCKVVPVIIINK